MIKNSLALVLEGGGMRGAYTAGGLSWLIDNGIEFESSYGISTGAVHLCNFLMKDKENLLDFSTEGIADPRFLGVKAFFHCGKFVDYDFLFNYILEVEKKYDLSPLKDCESEGNIGLYDCELGHTIYKSTRDIDINELKASTSLPILGKMVKVADKKYFDGGLTDMIPIEKAIDDGMKKFLIITTKPEDYVRKPSNGFVVNLMKVMYSTYPDIAKDYKIRHLNYNKQIEIIKDLSKQKRAVYCFPTETSEVTRLGGSKQQLVKLYDLGYRDMENRKDEIFELINA